MKSFIHYIGCDDKDLQLFESQYTTPAGMCYNSYVVEGERIAVIDSVDQRVTETWLNKLADVLAGRQPDYIIVQHMEPDHSGSLNAFLQAYPATEVVCTAKAQTMLGQFGIQTAKVRAVKEGESIDLGGVSLSFIMAPMVHWPEVMMTYCAEAQTLFSADAFGKFGVYAADEDDWACEARRYYFNICGKYGSPVTTVLKKASALDILTICPLHGPVLKENLGYYLNLYQTWSSYGVESEGVVIAYTSVYGNTKKAVELLAETLKTKGCPKVVVNDLARCDMAEAVEDAFRYGTLVLATTTYNTDVFPWMRHFIEHLTERNYQKRRVAFIENGSWAPNAAKVMKGMFASSKEIEFVEPVVTIRSALNEASEAQLAALADALA